MTQILEFSDKKFKVIIINILTALMEKVDNIKEQMGNKSIEMEALRKN